MSFDLEKARSGLREHLSPGMANIFSDEGMVGPLFYNSGINQKEIADKLKALGFKKIIITIRDQVKLVDSVYRQYIMEGGVGKVGEFFNRIFSLDYCNYYSLVAYYLKLFGEENVLVLTNCEMRREKEKTIHQIEQFTGGRYSRERAEGIKLNPRHANTSVSNLSVRLLRLINHFTYNKHKPSNLICNKISTWKIRWTLQRGLDPYVLAHASSRKPLIRGKHKQRVRNYYLKENRKLAKLIDAPLHEYGWPM